MNTAGFLANINGVGVTYRTQTLGYTAPYSETAKAAYYYDAARVFYQIGDYVLSLGGDPALWYQAAAKAAIIYRDGYLVPSAFAALGYWNFSQGLRMHWQRTGDLTSKNAVISLSQTAAYAQDFSTNVDIWDPDNFNNNQGGSREAAYAFMSHLDAEICGAPRRTRTVQMVDALLYHLDTFASGLAYSSVVYQGFPVNTYIRFFMVGLTCEAVIRGVGAGLISDTVARTKINAALDYLDTLYLAGPKTFNYTDRVGIPNPDPVGHPNWAPGDAFDPWAAPEDGLPAPDLNMLIAPAYAWCNRLTRAEDLFDGGVAGAWLGGGGNQKQFNQNYRWSFSLLEWVAAYVSPPPNTPPGEPPTTPPQGQGTVEVTTAQSACIPKIWTFGNPSSLPFAVTFGSGGTTGGGGTQPDPNDPGQPPDPSPPDAPPFDITTYGTPVLYYDFDQEVTSPVVSPDDLSTNNYVVSQPTAGYRVTLTPAAINDLQVASLTGGQGYDLTEANASAITKARTGLTIFMVAKPTDFAALQIIFRAYVGANARIDISLTSTNANAHVITRPQDAGTPYDDYGSLTFPPIINKWNFWLWKFDFAGNKLKHWVNDDVAINDVSINSTGNSSNTNCTGPDAQILWFNFYGGSGFKGQMAEFGILDGAISDADEAALKNALVLKYGGAFPIA